MRTLSKKQLTLGIIVAAVLVIGGIRWYFSIRPSSSPPAVLIKAKGRPDAPIHVVEFIDLECPACAQGALFLREYIQKHPNQIYLELKYFPLENMHPHAKLSAQYAECAARQGKFWPFHDLVIERQPQWKRLIDAKPAFEIMAVEADLDLYKLKFCLEDEKITAFIDQDKEEGRQKGVRSTPTYFINGKMVVGATALEEELTLLVGG